MTNFFFVKRKLIRYNQFLYPKGADTVVSDIDGLRYTTLLYGTGPGHSEPRALPLNGTTTPADAVHAAAVPRQWATHGGEDVPIYALGEFGYLYV